MSIIESLKNEGALVLYHDYRSGTAEDLSGRGHANTALSNVVFNKDGAEFNGTNAYIQVTDATDLSFGNGTTDSAMSIFAFFRKTKSSEGCYLASKGTSGTTGEYSLYCHPSGYQLDFGCYQLNSGNYILRRYNTTYPVFTHDFIVGTYDGSSAVAGIKIYRNGTQVDNSSITSGVYTAMSNGSSDLYIGRSPAGVYTRQTITSLGIINRVLTSAEIIALQAELSSMKWPSKPLTQTLAKRLYPLSTSNLTCAWDLEPKGATIADMAPGASNGTINKRPVFGTNHLGDYVQLAGGTSQEWINVADTSALDNPSTADAISLECWLINPDVTITYKGVISRWDATGNKRSYCLITNEGQIFLGISSTGTNYRIMQNPASTLKNNQIYHIIATYNGTAGTSGYTMYVNGVSQTLSENGASGDPDGIFATSTALRIGANVSYAAATNEFKGTIWQPMVHSRVIGAAEAAERYKVGAKLVRYKTDWGMPVSTANRTSGQREAPDWKISSGTWQITTDTINGKKVKVFNCIVAGVIYRKIQMETTPAAYGTWDWWYKKGAAGNASYFGLIADTIGTYNTTGQDAYWVYSPITTNKIALGESVSASLTALSYTADNYITPATWVRLKLTRRYDSAFTMYSCVEGAELSVVDVTGGYGTNPVTDATKTTAQYMTVALSAGDKFAIGDINGNYAFTKYLGII